MMFWSGHDMSGWGYAGMAVGMVLFWVLMILGIDESEFQQRLAVLREAARR